MEIDLTFARRKFNRQKDSAAHRGVEFCMTFDEWLAVWRDSGLWDLRGRTKNAYVMCRRGDVGPYAVGNVYFDTLSNNAADGQRGKKKRPLAIEKTRQSKIGKPRDEETRRKISESNRGLKHSPETVARRAASLRASWAKRKAKENTWQT